MNLFDTLAVLDKQATPAEWHRIGYAIFTNAPWEGHGSLVTDAEGLNITDADLTCLLRNNVQNFIQLERYYSELREEVTAYRDADTHRDELVALTRLFYNLERQPQIAWKE